MALLILLLSRRGDVFSRYELERQLWPTTTVGENSLARLVFKLRRALDDDPRRPRYVETIAKSGYRILPDPSLTVGTSRRWGRVATAGLSLCIAGGALAATVLQRPPAASALQRATDHYYQFTLEDNEAAALLYLQALETHPRSAAARAGLANTIVQRVLRWRQATPPTGSKLAFALRVGLTRTPGAVHDLQLARSLAEEAARLAPRDPDVARSLGLVTAAQGDLGSAARHYRIALKSDPSNWGALLNLADVEDIQGRGDRALRHLETAYKVMSNIYPREAVRIRPWQAKLGLEIADRYQQSGRTDEAARWWTRVLEIDPSDDEALANLNRIRYPSSTA